MVQGELRRSLIECRSRLFFLAQGLTASDFWQHSEKILKASREDVDAVIARILDSKATPDLGALSLGSSPSSATSIRETRITLELATVSRPSPSPSTCHIVIEAVKGPISSTPPSAEAHSTLILAARTGKAGYHPFFGTLDPVVSFASQKLHSGETVGVEVARSEAQGEAIDLGAALVLVLLGACSS